MITAATLSGVGVTNLRHSFEKRYSALTGQLPEAHDSIARIEREGSAMVYWDETVQIKRHHLDELRFYGFAGICIARFQQLDDHLRDPFASLLTISVEEAEIVFASIWTVKRRCEVIAHLLKARQSHFTIQ